jgi:hypothetical protein
MTKLGGLGDFAQRTLEVLGDVDGQRLQRRHVDHLGRVGHRDAPGVGPVQPVDAHEEAGQRLARPGGGGDQRVAAAGDLRPPLLLRGRGPLGEPPGEPLGDRRVEPEARQLALLRTLVGALGREQGGCVDGDHDPSEATDGV